MLSAIRQWVRNQRSGTQPMSNVVTFTPRGNRDVIEIRQSGSGWTVTIQRVGDAKPRPLADFDDLGKAEAFARHVADLRGSTRVFVKPAEA